MACGCNINPASEIGSCGLPANKEDVVRLFNMLLNNCCLGEISEIGLDPITNPIDSFAEAFPNGIESCLCECIYIRHTVTGQIYINCTENYTDNWCTVCPPSCLGFLETEGLTPDNPEDRIDAINEAFPIGLDNACEIHYIEREDGILCYSTDNGITWHCPLDSNYITTMRAGAMGGSALDPTGTNVTGVGQLISFFSTNELVEEQDDDDLIEFNGTDFSVNRSGRYKIKLCFQYSTAVNNSGQTSGFTFKLRRVSDGVIVAESRVGGDAVSGGERLLMSKCMFFDLNLDVGENYQSRAKFDNSVSSIIAYGGIGGRDFQFEYLG